MRKFQRGPEPKVLADNWEAWGVAWEQLQARNGNFHWHQHKGEPVNQLILPMLKEQTQEHCSFCDAFPVSSASVETIEHFQPKSRFPQVAYHWPNLYFCCTHCQQKGAEFTEALLRPDAEDFDFDRYFFWEYSTGELKPNPLATAEDRARAKVSIEAYHLNDQHPRWRRLEQMKRARLLDLPLDTFAYRHFI